MELAGCTREGPGKMRRGQHFIVRAHVGAKVTVRDIHCVAAIRTLGRTKSRLQQAWPSDHALVDRNADVDDLQRRRPARSRLPMHPALPRFLHQPRSSPREGVRREGDTTAYAPFRRAASSRAGNGTDVGAGWQPCGKLKELQAPIPGFCPLFTLSRTRGGSRESRSRCGDHPFEGFTATVQTRRCG